ncbi:hypothetical protein [Komagataeibacter sp. NFXK3]
MLERAEYKAEGLKIGPHVADRVLNHIEGTISGVGAVYQRSEFLRECAEALDGWAVYVLNVVNGMGFKPTAEHVVRLQR